MKLRKLFYILSKWILTLFSTSHNAIIGIFITYRSARLIIANVPPSQKNGTIP